MKLKEVKISQRHHVELSFHLIFHGLRKQIGKWFLKFISNRLESIQLNLVEMNARDQSQELNAGKTSAHPKVVVVNSKIIQNEVLIYTKRRTMGVALKV